MAASLSLKFMVMIFSSKWIPVMMVWMLLMGLNTQVPRDGVQKNRRNLRHFPLRGDDDADVMMMWKQRTSQRYGWSCLTGMRSRSVASDNIDEWPPHQLNVHHHCHYHQNQKAEFRPSWLMKVDNMGPKNPVCRRVSKFCVIFLTHCLVGTFVHQE